MLNSSKASSRRFSLRDATREAHERLDTAASRIDLSTESGYMSFLDWHGAVVPSIERHLERNGIQMLLPDWPARRRTQALVHDLAFIGQQEPIRERQFDLPVDRPSLWGIAYVMEGSRLGHEVLRRKVGPFFAKNATHYLTHGSGEKLWPAFVSGLDAQDFSNSEFEDATRAARATFGIFERALPLSIEKQEATIA